MEMEVLDFDPAITRTVRVRDTDTFLQALDSLRKTYVQLKEDLRTDIAKERSRADQLTAELERVEAENRELASRCERQRKTIEEYREWEELVLRHTAAVDGHSSLPPPPADSIRDPKTERGWLRKSPVFEKPDAQATQRSAPSRKRQSPDLLRTPGEGAGLTTPLSSPHVRPTVAMSPYVPEGAEGKGKAKATVSEPSPSLRTGSIQRLLRDMDEKMEWRVESQSPVLDLASGSPRKAKMNPVTDEETTEHEEEAEDERERSAHARARSREPLHTKPAAAVASAKEDDHLLSPTNYLNRLIPNAKTRPEKSHVQDKTANMNVIEKLANKADEDEEEDSVESVYSMFLGDDKRSPTSEQKISHPTVVAMEGEVESSAGEYRDSDDANEERRKGSSDTSEVEIIDVDALPARKAPLKRKKGSARKDNKADPSGTKGRKRQRTTIAGIQEELEERDDVDLDPSVTANASRARPRQRAAGRGKGARPETKRPRFDADADADDEYSTVYVGGSSEEEREAERTRKTDRRRKEAEDLRAFRVLLKEGAFDQQDDEDEDEDPKGNEQERTTTTATKRRSEGGTPSGQTIPLMRRPYASVSPDAPRPEQKERTGNTDYARVEVVRKKDERAMLPGHECEECAKFYDAIREGGLEFDRKLFVNNCSRHRSAYAAPDTPPHFWDLSFPETQPGTPPRDDPAAPQRP